MRIYAVLIMLAGLLGGCASGPYYYGGAGYRVHNIGGLPVSGSVNVTATSTGVMVSPRVYVTPYYKGWKK